MKIYILLLTYLLSTLSILSQNWERVDGPYDFAYVFYLFQFNDNIYASSSSDKVNYILKGDNWEFADLKIPTEESILFFKQKDSVVIFSTNLELFLSIDSGLTWKNIRDTLGVDIISHLHNAEIVGHKIYAYSEFGSLKKLYQYDILSNKWDTLKTISNVTVLSNSIVIDKNYIFSASYGNPQIPNSDYGLFVSKDYGKTWEKSNFNKTRIVSITIHKGILFLGGIDKHLYRSTDYGESWSVDTNLIMPIDLFYSFGDYLFAAVNSIGTYDGIDVGINVSTDNGVTWQKRHEGIEFTNIKQFIDNKNILYCQNERKNIFQTTNKGKIWTKSEIMTDNLKCYNLYTNQDTLLVATSSTNGLQFSTQEGTDWKTFGEGFNNRVESIYKRDSVYICIVNGKQFLEISKDYGKTWKEVGIGVSDPFKTLIQDVEYIGGDTLLVASLFGTRISTDFGKTWESFQNEILKSDFVTTNILRLDKNTLLIVASNEGIFKSNNNCRTWEKVPTTFQTLQSTQFNTFEYHNGRVYAFLPSHGLFFSEDRGLSWKEFSKDISEKGSDKGIIFYENYIIISAKDGILITSDDGESSVYHEIEKLANDDTFKTIVNDIAIQGDYLFASSDIGIWRVKLSDLGIVKSTVESQIERNYLYTFPPYPLPAKSEVKVLFYWDINIPMSIDDISIYDLSGQKLATGGQLRLVKNTNHNGNLIWDCSTVPAGIYLINIKHGTESESVKVVVE